MYVTESNHDPAPGLVCPACHGVLRQTVDAMTCLACGRFYPVAAGVPVMVPDAVPIRGPLLDPAAVHAVLSGLGLPDDAITALRVRRASGARAGLPHGAPAHRDGQILHRLLPLEPPSWETDGEVAVAWCAEYLPRVMRPGQDVSAPVRLRNAGSALMLASGDRSITIAQAWSGGDGAPVVMDDVRTGLVADLPPGAALTMPVRLRAPRRPGRYGVSLRIVQEGVRWLEPSFGPFQITVQAAAPAEPAVQWRLPDGRDLLASWLRAPAPRVLEIGNGAAPVAPGGHFNVDDDLLALQFGRLAAAPAGVAVFAGLDALPFPRRYFDAIVFFGTLHTMADPVAALRQVSAHLRPGGFIGVFDEPCGQAAASPGALAALQRGDAAQHFALRDWAVIFSRAALRIVQFCESGLQLSARLELEMPDA